MIKDVGSTRFCGENIHVAAAQKDSKAIEDREACQ